MGKAVCWALRENGKPKHTDMDPAFLKLCVPLRVPAMFGPVETGSAGTP